jgi:hypothetical protein
MSVAMIVYYKRLERSFLAWCCPKTFYGEKKLVGPIVGPKWTLHWVARVVAKCLKAHFWADGRTEIRRTYVRTDSKTNNIGG